MTLNEIFSTDNEFVSYLEKNCKQRAALMALVKSILTNEDESLTIRNVKICIANFFSRQIDEENMCHDHVEKDVMDSVVDFAKQEELLEEFKF